MGSIITNLLNGSDEIKNYAYVHELVKGNKILYKSANNILKDAHSKFNIGSQDFLMSTSYLASLASQAKTTELNFLNKYRDTLGRNKDFFSENWSEIVSAFNELLGKKDIYLKNLERLKEGMENYDKGGKFMRVNIMDQAFPVIKKNLAAAINNKLELTNDEICEIIKNSILQFFEEYQQKNNDTTIFSDLIQAFNNLQTSDITGIQEIANMLKPSIQKYEESRANGGKKKAQISVNAPGAVGNFSELINPLVVGNTLQLLEETITDITITAKMNNVKADYVLSFEAEIPDDMENTFMSYVDESGEKSVVMQNIYAWEKTLSQMSGDRTLIMVSNKDYILKSLESGVKESGKRYGGGFAAQTPTLANAESVMRKFGVEQLEDLIFTIINLGPQMIGENLDVTNIEAYLANSIVGFLFEDFDFDKEIAAALSAKGLNIVHLLNLQGILVPLSLYLEGLVSALNSLSYSEIKLFANVRVELPGSSLLPEKEDYEDSDWTNLVTARKNGTTVAMHFFENFASYILSKVSF